jgi:L-fuconolactonase
MTRRIDAHHHLWRPARGDYGWLTPDLAPIYRDFAMADLDPLLDQCGIDATILVQAAPTEAETAFMLAEAEASPRIAGVIGWIDFDAPDAAARVAAMAENPLIIGLRPMLHDIPDDDWLLRPHLTDPLREMARHRLALDALARPRHLARVTDLALRHPALTIVLDHIGKPEIAARRTAPWNADILALSALPNVFCKLSGMATEAAAGWTVEDLKPYADHVLSCFGASRVMWGSDWPVVDLAGGYLRWREASLALISALPDTDQELILGGVAERIYLGPRGR